MALSKEDLQRIKLPLSEKDYIMLHEEGKKDSSMWERVSNELWDAYEDKMIVCFDLAYPNNQVSIGDMIWVAPPER
ncbi:MAG: hypothetical protein PUE90_07030 [Bacteroidales bacterium]|nr:hypothetical protein [Bacteroidales bacterium]